MQSFIAAFESAAETLVAVSGALALSLALALVFERGAFAWWNARRSRLARVYRPLLTKALEGDDAARRLLAASPRRHRRLLAELLLFPMHDRRDRTLVDRARAVLDGLSMPALIDRYLESWCWWRRAMALRAAGFLKMRQYTPRLVAALDDGHAEIRAAALDGLADSEDPAALAAVVVRLHDETLHRGRRAAVLAAFGARCEPMLLDLAAVDAANRLLYARALAVTGTGAARPVLSSWIADARPAVRAGALDALGRTGLDAACAGAVVAALEDPEAPVRAAAARALGGAAEPAIADRVAAHLTDCWPVCADAARALRRMGAEGRLRLEQASGRDDLAGTLARQMLWEDAAQCRPGSPPPS
jgi:HEAT repeat protein